MVEEETTNVVDFPCREIKNRRCDQCGVVMNWHDMHIVTKFEAFCTHKCVLQYMDENPELFKF